MSRYLIICTFVVLCVACSIDQEPTPGPPTPTPDSIRLERRSELMEYAMKDLIAACEAYGELAGAPLGAGDTPEVNEAIKAIWAAYPALPDRRAFCTGILETTG